MLFGCKLRWTQKFPGTKQKAKLVKSTAVMMLVRQALCPRRQGLAPGTACTVTGTGFVPTDCTAPSSCSRTEPCLFISTDETLHLPALSVPPASSLSSARSVGRGSTIGKTDPGKRPVLSNLSRRFQRPGTQTGGP